MKIGDFDEGIDSASILKLVKKGLVEQFTDENGEFVFELTEIGQRVVDDIFRDWE
tara:strand:- start:245 stop:409 length:165 start_codon:yes stop_codon:yes gene_type:complete